MRRLQRQGNRYISSFCENLYQKIGVLSTLNFKYTRQAICYTSCQLETKKLIRQHIALIKLVLTFFINIEKIPQCYSLATCVHFHLSLLTLSFFMLSPADHHQFFFVVPFTGVHLITLFWRIIIRWFYIPVHFQLSFIIVIFFLHLVADHHSAEGCGWLEAKVWEDPHFPSGVDPT